MLLQLVKCHPLTQDAESPFKRCEQENLPPPSGQAFQTWSKAALESWGEVVSKAKRSDLIFQVTEITLGVELVESPFNFQKGCGFHKLYEIMSPKVTAPVNKAIL